MQVSAQALKWIFPYIRQRARIYQVAFACTLVLQFSLLAAPIVIQKLIDSISGISPHIPFDYILALLAIGIIEILCSYFRARSVTAAGISLYGEISQGIFLKTLGLPLSRHMKLGAGEVISRVNDVEKIKVLASSSTFSLAFDGLMCAVICGILYFYSPLLAIVVILPIISSALLLKYMTPYLVARIRQNFSTSCKVNDFAVTTLVGIESVQAFNVVEKFFATWKALFAEKLESQAGIDVAAHINATLTNATAKVTTLLVIGIGAGLVVSQSITIGILVAFMLYLGQLLAYTQNICNAAMSIQHGLDATIRAKDTLDIEEERHGVNTHVHLPKESKREPHENRQPPLGSAPYVQLTNVRYSYPDGAEVLNDVSLTVPRGARIAIIGPSGSGKSTLLRIVLGFYQVDSGAVLIRGRDIRTTRVSVLRQNIGYVPQEPLIINGTLRENIIFGRENVTLMDLERAIVSSGCDEFINKFDRGLDTEIYSYGKNLSHGQKQRISIARALLMDPDLLLLDEATNALDHETETMMHRVMNSALQGRTVILVSHRWQSIRSVDYICTLKDGRVSEFGSREELYAKKGWYFELETMQTARA